MFNLMPGSPLEVLLVDDQLGVRRGVELMLREAQCRVAGVAAGANEAASLLRRRRHDVAVLDTLLDGVPTAGLLTALLDERPAAPVVVYAGRDPEALWSAAAVRTPGLVLRSSPPARLLEALHVVAQGGRYVDPELATRLPDTPAPVVRAGVGLLSPRERQILGMLAEGCSGSEIAGLLFLSAETVRTHVRNAVRKLGARTRTQAVALLLSAAEPRPAPVRPR